MNEFDKKLNDLDIMRAYFNIEFNELKIKHPKLDAKLFNIFNNIHKWMLESQKCMNQLKQSIDTLEAKKANDAYYMNRPLTSVQKDNPYV